MKEGSSQLIASHTENDSNMDYSQPSTYDNVMEEEITEAGVDCEITCFNHKDDFMEERQCQIRNFLRPKKVC